MVHGSSEVVRRFFCRSRSKRSSPEDFFDPSRIQQRRRKSSSALHGSIKVPGRVLWAFMDPERSPEDFFRPSLSRTSSSEDFFGPSWIQHPRQKTSFDLKTSNIASKKVLLTTKQPKTAKTGILAIGYCQTGEVSKASRGLGTNVSSIGFCSQ